MTEYYYGNLEDVMDKSEICRNRGYGADVDSTHNNSNQWRVLAARLTFVIIFEVSTFNTYLNLNTIQLYQSRGLSKFDLNVTQG